MGRQIRLVATILLTAFALTATVFGVVTVVRDTTTPPGADDALDKDGPEVVVFYLHGDARCDACVTMQDYSEAAVRNEFSAALQAGELAFREINYHEPADAHYAEKFNIASPSLVIARYEEGQCVAFENLPDIWNLVHDEAGFHAYVAEHVAAALEQQ